MNDILQYMYQDGLLTSKELVSLRKTCRELNENPVRVLRSLNISSPEEILAFLQRAYRIPAVTERLIDALDESFKALIPIDLALHYGVFAVAEDGAVLHVAMEDPSDKGLIHKLEFFLERRIVPVAATVHQIALALNKLYDLTPEQLKLTTVIESSRGIVAGVKKTPAPLAAPLPTGTAPSALLSQILDEEASVQALTARALASPSEGASMSIGGDIFAEGFQVKGAMSLDDLASLEVSSSDSHAVDTGGTSASASIASMEPGSLGIDGDLFAELSSPEVLGGASGSTAESGSRAESAPTPKPASMPIDLAAGEVSFFDEPVVESAASPGLDSGLDSGLDALVDTVSEPQTESLLSDNLDADLGADLAGDLDADLGADLVGDLDADLGAGASLEVSLDTISDASLDVSLDSSLDVPMETSSEFSSDLLAESTSENREEVSVRESLDEMKPGVPGLSEIVGGDLSGDLSGDVFDNTLTEDTLAAADELLSEDMDVSNTLAAADVLLEEQATPDFEEQVPLMSPVDFSQSTIVALNSAVNASLVKLAMATNRAKGLEVLNQRLSSQNVKVESLNSAEISISFQGTTERVVFAEIEKMTTRSRLFEILLPALKRIEKLKT